MSCLTWPALESKLWYSGRLRLDKTSMISCWGGDFIVVSEENKEPSSKSANFWTSVEMEFVIASRDRPSSFAQTLTSSWV